MVDVLIVGAGPAGLSCAIEAKQNGLSATILEKGSLVDAVRRFPTNLVWFSTPELLEIGGLPFVTSTFRPNRVDVLNYYRRVSVHYKLDIRYFDAVRQIATRDGGFVVETSSGRQFAARNVVVATGYFDHPGKLNVPGEDLPTVFHYYHEPFRYFGSHVTVIGGRNSAVEAALDLYRHGAHVTLVHRGSELSEGIKYWILPDILNRLNAHAIRPQFSTTVREIKQQTILLETPDGLLEVENAFTFVLIGFAPDSRLLGGFGIETNRENLSPVHDPETMETNVPGLYVAGSIVAGKNTNKVFVENGRLHAVPIIRSILKDGRVENRLGR